MTSTLAMLGVFAAEALALWLGYQIGVEVGIKRMETKRRRFY